MAERRPRRTFSLLLKVIAAAALLAAHAGCGPRTLRAVDPCPDGGGPAFSSCPRSDGGDRLITHTLFRGLVGHWRLDDGAGSTMAQDSSENGNDGNLASIDSSTAWVTGHVGAYALETKGVGYAAVPKSPTIDAIVGQVSLAAWLYLDGEIFDYATTLSRQIRNSNTQYYHLALNQQARPSLFITPTVPAQNFVQPLGPLNSPVPPQTWTHLAGTYDGNTARLYVNGVLVESAAVTGTFGLDTTPLILGGNGNGNMVSERFPGRVDEILLYNRALDEFEVSQLAERIPL